MTLTSTTLNGYAYLFFIVILLLAGSASVIAFSHYFAKYFLINAINWLFGKKKSGYGNIMYKNGIFHRIAYLIPGVLLYHYSYLFNFDSEHAKIYLADLVNVVTAIYIMIVTSLIFSAALNCVNDRYRSLEISKYKPIKSYLQVIKIILFIVTALLIVSVMTGRSPAYLLTGATAAAAVFAVVFKDSVMGFIASIQLAANDMLRIGDWIEMPNFGADGEVIDISLSTVKVQNFDKTIVTIPSYSLLSNGMKNWRGMKESGGRRVKRSINLDIATIKICNDDMLNKLNNLGDFQSKVKTHLDMNNNQITNISVFRIYLEDFLRKHPGVHKNMKILVRQLQGTPAGLPIELCFFTNEVESERYETIQADIFDYIYALVPHFDLRVYQYASNND